MSRRVTSRASRRVTSPHLTSSHFTSPPAPPHLSPLRPTSSRVTSCHRTAPRVTLPRNPHHDGQDRLARQAIDLHGARHPIRTEHRAPYRSRDPARKATCWSQRHPVVAHVPIKSKATELVAVHKRFMSRRTASRPPGTRGPSGAHRPGTTSRGFGRRGAQPTPCSGRAARRLAGDQAGGAALGQQRHHLGAQGTLRPATQPDR